MAWVFTKTFQSGPDGYYNVPRCNESGQSLSSVQKYGAIPSGFSGVLYTDEHEGQEEHKQSESFVEFKKYYALKKVLARLNIKLSNYAPDNELTDIEKKAKQHRENSYEKFAPIVSAIMEIEDE